ncbi:MAG: sugar phosphate isomerase/epimerase [Candidatus Caldarchaeum sp.]
MSFRISLQLYTVRDETRKDFWGTCARVAEIGYEWVELAGLPKGNLEEFVSHFEALGLGISGAHVPYEKVAYETQKVCAEHLSLGCRDIIIPSLPSSLVYSVENWGETAKRLNNLAEECARVGIRLSFHNHDVEFLATFPTLRSDERGSGEFHTFWHQLMKSAPALLAQVDTYWVARAGYDVSDILEFVSGRVPSVHVKDMGADLEDVEFGRGVLDWSSIFNACVSAGVGTLVIELDRPKISSLESARISLENLRAFLQL